MTLFSQVMESAVNTPTIDPLLDSAAVCVESGGKSKMTLWRWQRDEKVNFPLPDAVINGRNYWYRSTIRRWQLEMVDRTGKNPGPAPRLRMPAHA
jgi:predicted DNA-binding transcriptional regulator AlpA